jgi:hypothetical protein
MVRRIGERSRHAYIDMQCSIQANADKAYLVICISGAPSGTWQARRQACQGLIAPYAPHVKASGMYSTITLNAGPRCHGISSSISLPAQDLIFFH